LPMAAVTAFACEWAAAGSREAAEIAERLPGLPALVGRAYRDGRDLGRDRAHTFAESDLVYCVGAGPLYGLAYKFGLTVFMENMRIHSSVIETAEFRHGPAEMLDRQAPDMAVLVGTDESRAMSERVLRLAGERGARTLVEGGAMGVDMRHVVVAAGHTGVTTITVTPDGERIFESEVLGTSGEFRPSAEATAFLATRSWVHATGPGHIVEALEAVAAA